MALGVGVIGAGTVGGGVVQTLISHRDIIETRAGAAVDLVSVADTVPERFREFDRDGLETTTNAHQLIDNPHVAVVCELIGGIEPARTFITRALEAGKHVVTANKMLLARHGGELARLAAARGVELRFEAAVAGGIPIIKALREGLAANRIGVIYGILNGTCNYILSRMTYDGLEFDEALRQAQRLGFAETPPDLDILGHDTAHKCQILASLAHSTELSLDDIYVEGVTRVTHADVQYARDMGFVIKLLAVIRDAGDAIEVRVHPTLVPEHHLLASVRNEFNAVYVRGDVADATLYYGRGAGRMPTASAVIADIIDVARRGDSPAPPAFRYGPRRPVRETGRIRCRYYLRLTTEDQPGVLGKVCTILGSHGVSIGWCIQKGEHANGEAVHVVLMTHDTVERAVLAALKEIDALDVITEPTHALRVLQE